MEGAPGDQQITSESDESTESQIAGPSSSRPTYSSSLNIREDIVQDPERDYGETWELIEEIIGDPERPDDETWEVIEEFLREEERAEQQLNKKNESEQSTMAIREADILTIEPGTSKQNLQESEMKPKKKYKCERCGRRYVLKGGLNKHKAFECGVMPQFRCKFCDKLFKVKGNMNRHILGVHQKQESKEPKTRHSCNQCSLSYSTLRALNLHKNTKHALVKPQFTCNFCGYNVKRKQILEKHIIRLHLKKPRIKIPKPEKQKEYKCEKCGRIYSWRNHLNRHQRFECDLTTPFRCDICGKEFEKKIPLSRHIVSMHLKKNPQAPQTTYNCDQCPRSFRWAGYLRRHKRIAHAAV